MLRLLVITPREPPDLSWCSIKEIGFSTLGPLKKEPELHKFYSINCLGSSYVTIKKITIFNSLSPAGELPRELPRDRRTNWKDWLGRHFSCLLSRGSGSALKLKWLASWSASMTIVTYKLIRVSYRRCVVDEWSRPLACEPATPVRLQTIM